jgi:hypothetical protein
MSENGYALAQLVLRFTRTRMKTKKGDFSVCVRLFVIPDAF